MGDGVRGSWKGVRFDFGEFEFLEWEEENEMSWFRVVVFFWGVGYMSWVCDLGLCL